MSLPRNGIKQFKNKMAGLADDLAALEALLEVDVPSSLNKIRFITEKVLQELCKRNEVSWGQAEPTLERMIGPLVAADCIPKSVAIHVRTIQMNTSPGSHYQESALSQSHVAIAQNALIEFLDWYCRALEGSSIDAGRTKPGARSGKTGRRVLWVTTVSASCLTGLAALMVLPPLFNKMATKQDHDYPPAATTPAQQESQPQGENVVPTTSSGFKPDEAPPSPQQITGNNNVQIQSIKNARDVIINARPKIVRKHVLDNAGSATLMLKEIKNKGNPLLDALDPSNQWGGVAAGTEVRIVEDTEEIKTPNPAIRFRKVEILEGDLKGKTGWVSSNVIRIVEVAR